MTSEMEQVVMQLIVNGGDARSHSLKAIQASEKGDLVEAKTLLESAKESLNKAHEAQTKLIQSEIRGENVELSLLMIHAQDHVMNAMTVRDLASHIVKSNELILDLREGKIK